MWWNGVGIGASAGGVMGISIGALIDHHISEEASESLKLANATLQAELDKYNNAEVDASPTTTVQPKGHSDEHQALKSAAMVALPALGTVGAITLMKAGEKETSQSVGPVREDDPWYDDSFHRNDGKDQGLDHDSHSGYDPGVRQTQRHVHGMHNDEYDSGKHGSGFNDDYSIHWEQRLTPTPLIRTQELPPDNTPHVNTEHTNHASHANAHMMMMQAASTDGLAQLSSKIEKMPRFR